MNSYKLLYIYDFSLLLKAGKEVAKSVVVAKVATAGAQRLGLGALASSAGLAAWGGGLMVARKVHRNL